MSSIMPSLGNPANAAANGAQALVKKINALADDQMK